MDYDTLEKRLKEVREDDHERGCEGRFYSCSCDYENQIDQALKDSQVAIADLRARNEALVKVIARSTEGWENAVELGLIPPQHRNTATILADEGCAALAANREG